MADAELIQTLQNLMEGFERMGEKLGAMTMPTMGFQPTPFSPAMVQTPAQPMMMTASPPAPFMLTDVISPTMPLTPPVATYVGTSQPVPMQAVRPVAYPTVPPIMPPVSPLIRAGAAFTDPFEAYTQYRRGRVFDKMADERAFGSAVAGEVGTAGVGLAGAALGAVGGVMGLALPMAGYFAGTGIYEAYHEAQYAGATNLQREGNAINRLMAPMITSGPELDITGRGFNPQASMKMAGAMAGIGKSRGLTPEDMRAVMGASIDEGLLDDLNTSGAAIQKIQKVMGLLGTVAKVTGDPDFQRNLQYIGQMTRMGVGVDDVSPMLQKMGSFARMGGVDLGTAMQTGGSMGASVFAGAGLSATMGIQAGVAAQGLSRAAVASGNISPEQLGLLGGESGIATGLQGATAGLYSKIKEQYLGAFVKEGGGGRFEIDPGKVTRFLEGNTSLGQLRNESLKFAKGREEDLYQQRGALTTQLQQQIGPENALYALSAFGRMAGAQYTTYMPTQSIFEDLGLSSQQAGAVAAVVDNPAVHKAMVQQEQRNRTVQNAQTMSKRRARQTKSRWWERMGQSWDQWDPYLSQYIPEFGISESAAMSEIEMAMTVSDAEGVGLTGTAVDTALAGGFAERTRASLGRLGAQGGPRLEGFRGAAPFAQRVTGAMATASRAEKAGAGSMFSQVDKVSLTASRDIMGAQIKDPSARRAFAEAIGMAGLGDNAVEKVLGEDVAWYEMAPDSANVSDALSRIGNAYEVGQDLNRMTSEYRRAGGSAVEKWMTPDIEGRLIRQVDATRAQLERQGGRVDWSQQVGGKGGLMESFTSILGGDKARARQAMGRFLGDDRLAGSSVLGRLGDVMRGATALGGGAAQQSTRDLKKAAATSQGALAEALFTSEGGTDEIRAVNELVREGGSKALQYAVFSAIQGVAGDKGITLTEGAIGDQIKRGRDLASSGLLEKAKNTSDQMKTALLEDGDVRKWISDGASEKGMRNLMSDLGTKATKAQHDMTAYADNTVRDLMMEKFGMRSDVMRDLIAGTGDFKGMETPERAKMLATNFVSGVAKARGLTPGSDAYNKVEQEAKNLFLNVKAAAKDASDLSLSQLDRELEKSIDPSTLAGSGLSSQDIKTVGSKGLTEEVRAGLEGTYGDKMGDIYSKIKLKKGGRILGDISAAQMLKQFKEGEGSLFQETGMRLFGRLSTEEQNIVGQTTTGQLTGEEAKKKMAGEGPTAGSSSKSLGEAANLLNQAAKNLMRASRGSGSGTQRSWLGVPR